MCQFFVKRGFETEKDWDEGMKCLKNHSRHYKDLLSFLKGSYYLTVQSVNLLQYVSDFALSFLEHVSELKLILVRLRNL